MHLAQYWWKQRKSNPLCCCWNLSHWLSACFGIDCCGLWWVKSLLVPFTQVCPCATTLSWAHQECPQELAQPLVWKHRRRKGGWMFSRLLHGTQWKAGKGTSWGQLCLGKEGRWSTDLIHSPTQCPLLLPSPSQAIPRLAFSSLFHTGISSLHCCLQVTWNCIFEVFLAEKTQGLLPTCGHWVTTVSTEPPPAFPSSAVPL